MHKLFIFITLFFSFLSVFSQEESIHHQDLIGTWRIETQRLDDMEITLSDCEKQSSFIFTEDEVIENYYKIYNGNCVILNTNKDFYTVEGNRIIRKEESDLNNTFVIKGEILTLSFTGKDDENEEHIAVIVCKRAQPMNILNDEKNTPFTLLATFFSSSSKTLDVRRLYSVRQRAQPFYQTIGIRFKKH